MSPNGPRVLIVDIETCPAKVYTWGLWNQNHSINQIIEPDRMICFAAKWLDGKSPMFYSEWGPGSQESMAGMAFALLDEADVVVTYNGDRFDLPWLTRVFHENGLGIPSPFVSVDLYKVFKKHRWLSHKLAYITDRLHLTGKMQHEGFDMWVACDNPDHPDHEKQCRKMRRYNKQDVVNTEELYREALPYVKNLPAISLYGEGDGSGVVCPGCGSGHFQRRGYRRTKTRRYPQYQCQDCAKWFSESRSDMGVAAS